MTDEQDVAATEQVVEGTTSEPTDADAAKPKRKKNARVRNYIIESLDDEESDSWTRVADEKNGGITSYATADAWLMDNANDGVPYRISIVTNPIIVSVVTTETRTMIVE